MPPLSVPARTVLTTALVAVAVRVAAAWCVPLVITNDGAGYLSWALALRGGRPVDWPAFRTPGYSGFLAGVIALLGESVTAIQAVQHTLGVLTAVLVTLMARRWGSPAWGVSLGCLAALDPVLLGFECYALTEALSTALLVFSAWLVLNRPGWPLLRACILGTALGALCLVRPAFQVVVPFFGVAVCVAPGAARRTPCGLALAAALGVTLAPWVVRNAQHGTYGLSGAKSVYFWIGAHQSGLLTQPPPGALREAYMEFAAPDPASDAGMHRFLGSMRAWNSAATQTALREWTWMSIRSSPGRYARALARAALWQLDVVIPGGPMPSNEARWLVRRLSRDGRTLGMPAANVQYTASPSPLEPFWTNRPPGWFGWYFLAWARNQPVLPIRVVLCACALAATVLAARAREYAAALVLAGTLAYWGVHAATLLHNSRYSLPCWVVWWVAPAVIVGCRRVMRRG
ncbi:MAG: hypothetical protein IT437_10605 [Phycisphaerales bacterium]|nr:hypothetical protein [Phycisphaerales bacterium]